MDSEDREAVSDERSERMQPICGQRSRMPPSGIQREKYESDPGGDHARLFTMVYFQRHAPAEILERWNILVGLQPSRGFGLRAFGQEITAGDVQVWLEKQGDRTVFSGVVLRKAAALLAEDAGKVWWMLSTPD